MGAFRCHAAARGGLIRAAAPDTPANGERCHAEQSKGARFGHRAEEPERVAGAELPEMLNHLHQEGRVAIIGAIYDIVTGDIEFLPHADACVVAPSPSPSQT